MPTTRDQLRELEGQFAHVVGRLKEWQKREDGTSTFLLVNCEVRPFDPDKALADVKPIKVDHMWQTQVSTEEVDMEFYKEVAGFGRVVWYARKDGSVDLTLDSVPSLRLDDQMAEIHATSRSVEATTEEILDLLRETIEHIDEGVAHFSWFWPTRLAVKNLRRAHRRMEENHRREQAGRAYARGKCRGLDLFKPRGGRRQAQMGFA